MWADQHQLCCYYYRINVRAPVIAASISRWACVHHNAILCLLLQNRYIKLDMTNGNFKLIVIAQTLKQQTKRRKKINRLEFTVFQQLAVCALSIHRRNIKKLFKPIKLDRFMRYKTWMLKDFFFSLHNFSNKKKPTEEFDHQLLKHTYTHIHMIMSIESRASCYWLPFRCFSSIYSHVNAHKSSDSIDLGAAAPL